LAEAVDSGVFFRSFLENEAQKKHRKRKICTKMNVLILTLALSRRDR